MARRRRCRAWRRRTSGAPLRRPQRQGIGPAYIAGFTQALRDGADYIVQMDADFSHPVDMLPAFLELIPEYDMVLGSRYLSGITVVNWPIERLLISYFGNWYARRVTGLPIADVTGGFKCWRRETLERIPLRARALQWLRISGGNDVPRLADRSAHQRGADHLPGAHRRRVKDEQVDRRRSAVDLSVAARDDPIGPAMSS